MVGRHSNSPSAEVERHFTQKHVNPAFQKSYPLHTSKQSKRPGRNTPYPASVNDHYPWTVLIGSHENAGDLLTLWNSAVDRTGKTER